MTRKILITVIIFLIVIAFIVGLYLFFVQPEEGEEGTTIADFFPFGRGEDVGFDEDGEDIIGAGDENGADEQALTLRQVADVPVAGAVLVESDGGKSIRYIERTTGHVYEVGTQNFQKTRLTNTTIPAVREAFWKSDGTSLALRYLNTNDVIKTFAATLSPSTEGDTPNQLRGLFIDDEIQFVASSPEGGQMFYLFPFETNTVGIISDFDGTNRKEVFNSPFNEWLPQWPEVDTVSLTTKAASIAEGFLYFLDIKNGELEKILGNVSGLTSNTSPDLNFILFSESVDNFFQTKIYNRGENISYDLPITTLPEKCVWSKTEQEAIYCGVPSSLERGAYPDIWYQGVMSFSDTIWKVNVATRVADQVVDPTLIARTEFDIINPSISSDGELLLFTNKKDSTLWSLTLTENE